MLRDWRSELNRFLILIAAAAVVGLLAGKLTLLLLLAVMGYLAHTFYQLYRLYSWLYHLSEATQSELPEATGIWGNIFDGIYRLQRRERDAANYLKNILNKAQESSAALEMAVVMINHKGNLEWWNRAAEKLLGFRAGDDRQQPVTNLLRDEMRPFRFGMEYAKAEYALRDWGVRSTVVVFGSARFKPAHPYYKLARATGAELAKAGFATLTGGGPGIQTGGQGGAQGLTDDQVRVRTRDPRYNTQSREFDPEFAAETERLLKERFK